MNVKACFFYNNTQQNSYQTARIRESRRTSQELRGAKGGKVDEDWRA